MNRAVVLLVALAASLGAQSATQVRSGALQCGVIRRAIDRVQLYCYAPDPANATAMILVGNEIRMLRGPSIATFQWDPVATQNYITWQFASDGTTITYFVVLDGRLKRGKLTSDYQ